MPYPAEDGIYEKAKLDAPGFQGAIIHPSRTRLAGRLNSNVRRQPKLRSDWLVCVKFSGSFDRYPIR